MTKTAEETAEDIAKMAEQGMYLCHHCNNYQMVEVVTHAEKKYNSVDDECWYDDLQTAYIHCTKCYNILYHYDSPVIVDSNITKEMAEALAEKSDHCHG